MILRPAFNILTICGCWRPSGWSTIAKRVLYGIHTIVVFLLIYSFWASQLLNVILNVETADELSDSVYMFIANCLSCCKIVTLLMNHENIRIMTRKLEEEPCKPINTAEVTIQRKFDKRIGLFTIYYTILVELTVLCMILTSLFTNFRNRKLTYRAWLPFNYTDQNLYYVAYTHQLVSLVAVSLMNVACDVIVIGLYVHASSQQEILKHRLKEFTQKTVPDFGKLVNFHNFLYKYISTIQETFKVMIGVQFLSSTLVVCFILYQLANTPPTSFKFLEFAMYMICMTTQIFIYCWYGNQLKLKSVEIVDTISQLDWVPFANTAKKNLLMIMRRTMKPINLTTAYVFTIDLNTFVSILKMSYSTFNLLQRSVQLLVIAYVEIKKEFLKLIMPILRWVFMVLSVCGCWRPLSWTSKSKKVLYTIYTVVLLCSTHIVAIFLILDLVLIVDNAEDFSDNLHLTAEYVVSLWKMDILLKNRENFVNLLDTLETEPLAPVSTDEIAIRKKFDKYAELNTIAYGIGVSFLLLAMFATALFLDDDPRKLAFRVWLPYNYSSPLVFTFTFVSEVVNGSICSFLNVGGDSLFSGFLIHTYCLLEIFRHRLKDMNEPGNYSLKKCARLHNRIYKFATMVNEEFKIIMMMQFMVSTTTLCSELYRLSQSEMGTKYVAIVLYASCTFTQILFFCWYGNEVRLKSLEVSDMIYESKWIPLNPSAKKILLIIMLRSTSPIEFTSAQILSMNLASFMAILKASYSAYNMLQR
ncbi:uncharacterized protein LOC128877504 [Hylaeus volcanicus]|uniref:uncharacterized protein LOC128877504 n=1 Tax=Hylaeus volcanicus TaxID=313075 RepID=UPI0023B8021A|nr:uncharacterized protein LOC128877504 [Hylaeus volcanicus]